MATSMRKTTKASEGVEELSLEAEDTLVTEDIQKEEVKKPMPKKKRVFNNSDEIECVSITQGQYFVEGERSKELYIFADADDVQWIRYDDLLYMVRRKTSAVFSPRFIIRDEDFLAQHPEINRVYGGLYSNKDLKNILSYTPSVMKTKLSALPPGVRESFKTLAATEVQRGRLDSVKRIKIIDDFFGTNLLSLVTNN